MAVLDTPRAAPVQRAAPRTRLTLVPEPTALSMADPGRLLELAAGGDLDAFARFYDLLAPRAYGLALRVLRDPGYAEETVQEVFLQVWKQAVDYRPSLGSVQSWVLTITHRRAVDRVRAESSATRRDEVDAAATAASGSAASDDVAEQVTERIGRDEDAARVRGCLETLTDTQRESIEMAYFTGLTYREVADRLGAALPTVKSRIRDGLRRLKGCLGGALA
ncbi:sigma-70 family RNA polymerase sigma factor SigK [Dietzia aurantiaca]